MNAGRLLPVLLALVAATPEVRYFHYQRPVTVSASQGQACLAIDPALFPRAAPGLGDLRLYRVGAEEPYLVHFAAAPQIAPRTLPPINTGRRGGHTVFDVEMPAGRYQDVDLALAARDFVATVAVTGSQVENGPQTRIGSYTVFDLTSQKLGRGTMLALPVSDFRLLHFAIAGPLKAENIQGIRVSNAAQEKPRYIEVERTGPGAVRDRSTVLTAEVRPRTPVDRIVFTVPSDQQLFQRTVTIARKPLNPAPNQPNAEEPVATASLLRIHGTRLGQRIDEERLEIAIPASPSESASAWTITIDNGDDKPLSIQSARLEMLERDLCFDARSQGALALYYGDDTLSAPRYDYAALAEFESHPTPAALGPETPNPDWQPRPDIRPLTERYPWLLWVALCAVIALLGLLTLRTARRRLPS